MQKGKEKWIKNKKDERHDAEKEWKTETERKPGSKKKKTKGMVIFIYLTPI